jgi:hypothetical protein
MLHLNVEGCLPAIFLTSKYYNAALFLKIKNTRQFRGYEIK